MTRPTWDRGTRPPDNLPDDLTALTDTLHVAGVAWEEADSALEAAEHEVQYEAGAYIQEEVETLPGQTIRTDGRNWTRVWPPESGHIGIDPARDGASWSPWRTPIYRDPRQQAEAEEHIENLMSGALDRLDESLPLETDTDDHFQPPLRGRVMRRLRGGRIMERIEADPEPEIDPRIKKIRVIR